jgi:hypothetical protein
MAETKTFFEQCLLCFAFVLGEDGSTSLVLYSEAIKTVAVS